MIFFFFQKRKKKIVQKWWLALFGILESPMMSNNQVLNFHKVPKKDLVAQKMTYGDDRRRDNNYTTHAPVLASVGRHWEWTRLVHNDKSCTFNRFWGGGGGGLKFTAGRFIRRNKTRLNVQAGSRWRGATPGTRTTDRSTESVLKQAAWLCML